MVMGSFDRIWDVGRGMLRECGGGEGYVGEEDGCSTDEMTEI